MDDNTPASGEAYPLMDTVAMWKGRAIQAEEALAAAREEARRELEELLANRDHWVALTIAAERERDAATARAAKLQLGVDELLAKHAQHKTELAALHEQRRVLTARAAGLEAAE